MSRNSLSRRRFLQASGAAALWLPTSVAGYTAAEMRQFYANGEMSVNVSKWELDTPALCVDLDLLEANLDRMASTMSTNGIASRPHAKTHKCPTIAQMQMDRGSVGICTAKVSEAEAMFQNGIDNILNTTGNVTPTKINRAMNLRQQCPGFIQATDSQDNARLLSEAAVAKGIIADVVVDVDPGIRRTGTPFGQPALQLAQLVDQLPGLNFVGMLCYDAAAQHVVGFETRKAQTLERMVQATDTFEMMKASGLNTEIFSGGGTGTYNIDHDTKGLTDVQVGSYVFMDAQYISIGGEEDNEVYSDFHTSLTIMTTVLNDQYEGKATSDAGAKACTINQPWPIIKGETGMSYRSGSDEFGTITYQEDASRTYKVGEKLEVIVSHCDPVVNLYDQMYAIRGDKVEAVWPISARGMSA
ncbi:MAG: DSD1 family PLP-dependent enzyme [Gammaproteobacteria bacterium]|jgi:D-serine deaminase-like pyridoxal phosphate-dependent protein|nr:DSD1 family PLP-dependent enzyme [Gammaproteobacteria bacterium]MBT3858560.1 DSD1 family PLP-dependent enzyme [Gammaproteobacteria bacterium]MBT3986702.1 DSD1 family PLP-dependent enzyme [Gammaproteobacteria bacterium]MBT4257010.1 DSD1 family PLP-dependent enzyme [Gammaproteobacteria bacterium]MBT4582798.1 DSD1 family PLP-dependent enzyme [Gammaproteobacteria bacterium]